MFRHADGVCLCLVCILWQFSMLRSAFHVNVNAGQGDYMEEAYYTAGIITALYVAISVSFCLPHPVVVNALMICRGLCA